MANYLIGYGQSAIKVYDYVGYIRTYTLPMCNEGGLIEDNLLIQNVNELENGTLSQRIFGIRKKYTLDYSQYLTATQILEVIQPLIDDYLSGYRLVFYPKLNNLNYNFEVIISNANFVLAMIKNTNTTVGMQGIVLELTAKNYTSSTAWLDADSNGSGYFGISTLIE